MPKQVIGLPTSAPERTIAKVLAGQKALVTGANSGIGQAAEIALAWRRGSASRTAHHYRQFNPGCWRASLACPAPEGQPPNISLTFRDYYSL